MGISKGGLKLLLAEARRRPFEGQILTLGKQHTFITSDVFKMIIRDTLGSIPARFVEKLSNKREFAEQGYLSDDCLFRAMGFSVCHALDCSDFEGASFIFDLNRSDLPGELLDRFDVIYDGGTLEHVFHVPAVLNNIFKMLQVGGRIIHGSPSSNHVDHGFYMFSPTMFWDFYCANGFEINTLQICRYTPNHNTDLWEISNYRPGCLNHVSFGGLDDAMYLISCVATKTAHATGHVAPQQGMYLKEWARQGRDQDTNHPGTAPRIQLSNSTLYAGATSGAPEEVLNLAAAPASKPPFVKLKRALRNVPFLFNLLRFIYRKLKPVKPIQKGLGLEVVARY